MAWGPTTTCTCSCPCGCPDRVGRSASVGRRGRAVVIVTRLELVDFRNYTSASFDLRAGTTAVVGLNGQGKTNFAEALAYLSTLASFRGAPDEALVRVGAATAIVRATIRHDDDREVLVEAEINRLGRNRVLVNRQKLGRTRELLGVVRVSVFSPDDLALVKDGPGERRTVPRRHARRPGPEVRRAAARARPGGEAAQHVAEAGRRSARRGRRAHARRVGCQVRRGRRPVRSRPLGARVAPRPDGGRGVRAARRPGDPRRAALRTGVAPARAWPRPWPTRAPTTSAAACRPWGRIATTSTW